MSVNGEQALIENANTLKTSVKKEVKNPSNAIPDKTITIKSTDAGKNVFQITDKSMNVNGEQALIENANVLKNPVEGKTQAKAANKTQPNPDILSLARSVQEKGIGY